MADLRCKEHSGRPGRVMAEGAACGAARDA